MHPSHRESYNDLALTYLTFGARIKAKPTKGEESMHLLGKVLSMHLAGESTESEYLVGLHRAAFEAGEHRGTAPCALYIYAACGK